MTGATALDIIGMAKKLSPQERDQIVRHSDTVSRIIRQAGAGTSIPMAVIQKAEDEITSSGMIDKLWSEVIRSGMSEGVFNMYIPKAINHKLVLVDHGGMSCGGMAGFSFLPVPDDYGDRVALPVFGGGLAVFWQAPGRNGRGFARFRPAAPSKLGTLSGKAVRSPVR